MSVLTHFYWVCVCARSLDQTYVEQAVARGDRADAASGGGRQRPAPQVMVADRSAN
jgi:hypothetical protein